MKFSIKDFFSFLRIFSYLLEKSLMENLIFCALKCLEVISLHHFLHEFERKMFLLLYSIN